MPIFYICKPHGNFSKQKFVYKDSSNIPRCMEILARSEGVTAGDAVVKWWRSLFPEANCVSVFVDAEGKVEILSN